MQVKRKCKKCKSIFYIKESDAKRGRGKFCSKGCAGKWMSGWRSPHWKGGRIALHCKQCNNKFQKTPAVLKYGEGVFCSRKCKADWQKTHHTGMNHPSWKGGRFTESTGYIQCRKTYRKSDKTRYRREHRLVMEKHLLRVDPIHNALTVIDGCLALSPEYHVHHKNGNKSDNRIENLEVMTHSEHSKLHNGDRQCAN